MFFVCKHCREEFEGKPGEEKRVFCSSKCFRDFRKAEEKQSCPHNIGVVCHDRYNCFRCGWSPAVEQRRKEAMA